MIERTLIAKMIALAQKFQVLTLTGPRQSGKTTLVREPSQPCPTYFDNLKFWRSLAGPAEDQGFVVYGGDQSLQTSAGA